MGDHLNRRRSPNCDNMQMQNLQHMQNMQGKAGLLLLVIFSAVHGQQVQQWTQTENRGPLRDSRLRGANGPASNIGGLIAWSSRETFHWERLKRQAVECCSKVLVSATGPAARVQWDRMGLYYATGQTLHGRQVYQHENWTQSIFYIYGEYDGWMPTKARRELRRSEEPPRRDVRSQ